jgi:hypothetical protein
MRRVLAPSGRLALNVYGPIEHNPATHALADALDRHLGPDASIAKRTEHALADAAQLRELVERAGFAEVAIERATKAVRFPSAADYVRVQLAATPLAGVMAERRPSDEAGATAPDEDRAPGLVDDVAAALVNDVAAALAAYVGDDGLTFPQEMQIALARS